MLTLAIKSYGFIPYKKTLFYKMKSLKKRRYFILALGYCHENVLYKVFNRNISGTVTDHVKVYP